MLQKNRNEWNRLEQRNEWNRIRSEINRIDEDIKKIWKIPKIGMNRIG